MASYTKIKANNKQGYKWICTLEGPPDPVTGKRKQIPRRGDTQKEALARAQESLKEYVKSQHGPTVRNNKIFFNDAAREWLRAYSKTKVKQKTIDTRQNSINILLRYYDQKLINKLTYKMHEELVNDIHDKGFSISTIKGAHSVSNMIMKYALKNKWITENPFSEVKLPAKLLTVEEIENDPIQEKFFENEELAEFLLTAKEHGLYLDNEIFHLLAFSGLRPGELCALKDSDFFFETNEIRVTKTLYYPKNNMRLASLTPPKTTGSVRRFDVLDTIMFALEKHISSLEKFRDYNKKSIPDYHDNTFVFARPNGYPVLPANIMTRMQRLLKKTSIKKKATPHIFRHTHVSMLAEAEVDLKTIMDRVGHEDAKTTLKIYTHVTKKMKKNATEKIKMHYAGIVQI
ncbi:site-specific integrase [Paenibacillus amylolyticus]|uniref:Site-specific integrase n=1 Tax=Paenibacillus amylolyticus TaxID=1451 RepID=A0A1R1C4F8_PAEAM|nr:site-specific integrase [Paenibacillus amylolyticus]OMF17005.1 site-specific integrase [Paenibacillus amylolyticus]